MLKLPDRIETTETFAAFLQYLHDHGGQVSIAVDEWCRILDIGEPRFRGIRTRAAALGVVEVRRNVGRSGSTPNTYRLLMPLSEWHRNKAKIVQRFIDNERERTAPNASARRRKERERRQRAEEPPRDQIDLLLAVPHAPLFTEPTSADEIDVDAWADSVDFDWPLD